jgi:hypothetical protein
MVGSTFPRSDSLSVADAAAGGLSSQKTPRTVAIHGHVPNGGLSELRRRRHPTAGLAPQNSWSSRSQARHVRADLIAGSNNNSVASLSGRPSPVLAPSSQPSGQPKAAARAPSTVPVAVITCAAIGGAIIVATLLALVYYFRIRRRVKRMKRCMDILGPGTSFRHSAVGPKLTVSRLVLICLGGITRARTHVAVPVFATLVRLTRQVRWDAHPLAVDVRSD